MNILTKTVLFISIIIATPFLQSNPALGQGAPAATKIEGVEEPFDFLAKLLAVNKDGSLEKSAFETKDQYNERIRSLRVYDPGKKYFIKVSDRPTNLKGSPNLLQRAFKFEPGGQGLNKGNDNLSYSFDADKGLLTVYGGSDPSGQLKGIPRGACPISLLMKTSEPETYTATNGFGAQVEVTHIQSTHMVLNILNKGDFDKTVLDGKSHVLKATMKCDGENAQKIVQSYHFVVGIEGVTPFSFGTHKYRTQPTFHIPYKQSTDYLTVDAKVSSIYLVDDSNNIISEWHTKK